MKFRNELNERTNKRLNITTSFISLVLSEIYTKKNFFVKMRKIYIRIQLLINCPLWFYEMKEKKFFLR